MKIRVKIGSYSLTYEQGEEGWFVFGQNEDAYILKTDIDVCKDMAKRLHLRLEGNLPIINYGG